jgi:ferritin-like metal-binding protein YciE
MHHIRQTVSLVLSCTFFATPALAQQSHIAEPSVIDARVAAKAAETAEQRATIERLLDRKQVREIAERTGIDMSSVEAAVSTLDGEELAEVASQAQKVDDTLAGGASTVTISTTAIIIGLLILILIIVAT